jgi:hypothetical protein
MITVLKEQRMEGMYLNKVKDIYGKLIANSISNREKLTSFPLKSRMNPADLLSPFLFNIVLEFLARTIRQKKEMQEIKKMEEVK